MNTFTKLLAATALMASTSTAALAQVDVGADVGADVEVGTDGGPNANANENAAANANANAGGNGLAVGQQADGAASLNYGNIVSSLRTSTVTSADVEALEAGAEVQVINLADLQGNAGENASAIDQAVADAETDIEDLRTAISANAEVAAALEAAGYAADNVVAVTTGAEGGLILVVDEAA